VQVHAVHGHAMDGRFGFTQPLKQRLRPILSVLRQRRAVNQRVNLRQRPVRPVMAMNGLARFLLFLFITVIVVMIVIVMVLTMIVRVIRCVLAPNAELGGRETGAGHAFGPDDVAFDRQTAQRTANRFKRHAGVDQRPENHVAGCAGEAVEVENPQS